jgi:hypothetical protein
MRFPRRENLIVTKIELEVPWRLCTSDQRIILYIIVSLYVVFIIVRMYVYKKPTLVLHKLSVYLYISHIGTYIPYVYILKAKLSVHLGVVQRTQQGVPNCTYVQ